MRPLIYSLAAFFVFAVQSWAQEAQVGAIEETAASAAVKSVDAPPAAPGPEATQETLEQRVQRLEAELERARSAAAQADPGAASVAVEPAIAVDNSWRYKQHNGKWWYWLPSERWVYWSNGAWVDHVPGTPVVVAAPSFGVTSGYGYYPYATGYRSYYRPSIGVYTGGGYGYGYGHSHHHGHGYGHGWHGGHGHGHIGHGHGGHGYGHGHGGHGGHGHH